MINLTTNKMRMLAGTGKVSGIENILTNPSTTLRTPRPAQV